MIFLKLANQFAQFKLSKSKLDTQILNMKYEQRNNDDVFYWLEYEENGDLYGFGDSGSGQLTRNGGTLSEFTLLHIGDNVKFRDVACGYYHSTALDSSLFSWKISFCFLLFNVIWYEEKTVHTSWAVKE